MKAKELTRIALFAALLAALSQLALPLGAVPLTVQVFGVALCGKVLGAKKSLWAVGVWLLLGALGAPVFYGFQGGIAHLLGPSGGFLWGFLGLAFFSGLSKKPWCLLGLALCHLLGVLQFSFVSGNSLWISFLQGSLPYLLKDLLLTLGGVQLGARIKTEDRK